MNCRIETGRMENIGDKTYMTFTVTTLEGISLAASVDMEAAGVDMGTPIDKAVASCRGLLAANLGLTQYPF